MSEIVLETRNLSKSFGTLAACKNVNLDLRHGEIHALIGPNGAGKSTLFNLITGLLTPSSGKVFFRDENITDLSIDARVRKGIGKSFQIVSLFPGMTVRDHMLIAVNKNCLKSHYAKLEIEKVERILVGLDMVNKADRVVGSLTLSEQRKLDAGLLLALDCELLLLDEPFAGLAAGQMAEVKELLLQLAKEKTILIIEHRLGIVMELASRVIVLSRGTILADGDPAEIQQNSQVVESYLGGEHLIA